MHILPRRFEVQLSLIEKCKNCEMKGSWGSFPSGGASWDGERRLGTRRPLLTWREPGPWTKLRRENWNKCQNYLEATNYLSEVLSPSRFCLMAVGRSREPVIRPDGDHVVANNPILTVLAPTFKNEWLFIWYFGTIKVEVSMIFLYNQRLVETILNWKYL